MNWSSRQRPDPPSRTPAGSSASPARAPSIELGSGTAAQDGSASFVRRVSNGLKELLSAIEGAERGELLDLGSISQATVEFFTSRGFRLHSHDLLRAWREFLSEELERPARDARPSGRPDDSADDADDPDDRALRPSRFLARHLWFEPKTFHGVLLWDSLDYLDASAGAAVVARLAEILRPGGAALLHLHDKPPERFWRYRILDSQTLECVPATPPVVFQRPIANREIMKIFHDFRTSKTFVGRDHIREVLFLR